MLNTITIMGRLTKDPELRHTGDGTAVTGFTVACDRDFGEEKQTDFIDCVAWRKTGEFVSKYFRKGAMVCVDGRLQSGSYTDKDGIKRITWKVNAEHVYFCEGKKQTDEVQDVMAKLETLKRPEPKFTGSLAEDDDGALPF